MKSNNSTEQILFLLLTALVSALVALCGCV